MDINILKNPILFIFGVIPGLCEEGWRVRGVSVLDKDNVTHGEGGCTHSARLGVSAGSCWSQG